MRYRLFKILVVLLFFFNFVSVAYSGDLEDGIAAYNRGEFTAAVSKFRKAADQGIAEVQFNLGLMYAKGQGVPQDYSEAGKWSRKAAEQGDAAAQNNLGVMYEKGRGAPQDYISAYMWFNLSSFHGNEEASKSRDRVLQWMTPAQIEKAQALTREWLEKRKK